MKDKSVFRGIAVSFLLLLLTAALRAEKGGRDGLLLLQVLVTVLKPEQAHYPHIAGTPAVQLNPEPT